MKLTVCLILAAYLSFAQQSQTSTSTVDINGRRAEGASSLVNQSPGSSDRIEMVRSVNGRNVPLESREDKVISDGGGVKIIERLVKRYDANGRPSAADKIHIEEKKSSDGTVNTAVSVMRANINGSYTLAERSVSESKKSGETTTTSTVIERPTLNGSMELVERKENTRRESADGSLSETSALTRKDANGRFGEVAKEVREKTVASGNTVENVATYEATSGGLQLVRQTVSKETAGSNQKQIDVFDTTPVGRTGSTKPELREQRVVERTTTATGAVDSISVRRPLASDPNKLGNLQKVEEVVCTGKCK